MKTLHRIAKGPAGSLLALFAAVLPVAAQSSLIAREHGATHDLHAIDSVTGQATLEAGGLTFLPLDLQGYPVSERLLPGRPVQLSAPLPGVRLPLHGSLFRVQTGGQTALLHARADGATSLRAATRDVGAPALLAGLTVSPDGDAALLASEPTAGGDVFWLDLTGDAAAVDLTAGLPPLAVEPASLRLHADTAWFVADGTLHVVDLLAGTAPTAFSLPLAVGEQLLPELATSADGRSVAVIAESTPDRRRLFVATAGGAVSELTGMPVPLSAPSYDQPAGPLLALSSDGSCVAWRQRLATQELFVQRLDLPTAPVQVTADGNFIDTIDNVAVLGFIGPAILVFAAGELPGPLEPGKAIGSADFFLQDTTTGSTFNVTQTSGVPAPPFTAKGELEVMQGVYEPGGQRLLLDVDPNSGDSALLGVPLDGSPGLHDLLPNLAEPPLLVRVGDQLLVSSLRDPGSGLPLRELHLLPPGGQPQLLVSLPGSVQFDRFASLRDGTGAAFVASAGPDLQLAVRFDLATAGLAIVWPQPLALSSALGFAPDGQLLAGLGLSGGPFLFARFPAPGVGALLSVPKGNGFPLSP